MKQLFSSPDSARVGLAQSLLEAADIRSEIRNDAVSQVMPGFPFASQLWVRDEDYAEASRLLADVQGDKS